MTSMIFPLHMSGALLPVEFLEIGAKTKVLRPASLRSHARYLMVSLYITNPEAMRVLRTSWAQRSSDHRIAHPSDREAADPLTMHPPGGAILLFELEDLASGPLASLNIPMAFGMAMLTGASPLQLYVASAGSLARVRKGQVEFAFDNPLFNDLHGVTCTSRGTLLVSSTGTDGIFELDPLTGTTVWGWLARENGFPTDPAGRRSEISRAHDYRRAILETPRQTTHINSAIELNSDTLLATFFHQGELRTIDRRHGISTPCLSGLRCPHHIRRRNSEGGFIVSDSRNDRILFLDQAFAITEEIRADFNWVQDCVEVKQELLAVIDSNNDRICLLTTKGAVLNEYRWPAVSVKPSSLALVSGAEAAELFQLPSTSAPPAA